MNSERYTKRTVAIWGDSQAITFPRKNSKFKPGDIVNIEITGDVRERPPKRCSCCGTEDVTDYFRSDDFEGTEFVMCRACFERG